MVELQENHKVEIDWRGFFLHPEIPDGGVSVESLVGKGRADEFKDYLERFASGFGVPIRFPTHVPRTQRALAMTCFAKDEDRLHPFQEAVMDAYWLHERDIEDSKILKTLAKDAGLDPDRAIQAADDPAFHARVQTVYVEGKERKVTGIPTVFVKDKMLVGCHPLKDLERILP